jgi:hypothetical protein
VAHSSVLRNGPLGSIEYGEFLDLSRNNEVVGLERGPLSLVRITEELLQWKSSGSESRKPSMS